MMRRLVEIVWLLAVIVWLSIGGWWLYSSFLQPKPPQPKWPLDRIKKTIKPSPVNVKTKPARLVQQPQALPQTVGLVPIQPKPEIDKLGVLPGGQDWVIKCTDSNYQDVLGGILLKYDNGIADWIKITGVLTSIRQVPESKDKYMDIKDPVSNKIYTVRLLYQPSRLSTTVNLPNKINGANLTQLGLVRLGDLCSPEQPTKTIGRLKDLSDEELKKYLQPGVVVEVFTIPVGESEPEYSNEAIRRDENGVPAVSGVRVRYK